MKREENQTVEYKQSWHDKCMEWICGDANAKGGTLLAPVVEADGYFDAIVPFRQLLGL